MAADVEPVPVQEGTRSTMYLWDRYQVGVHAEGVCARLDPMECSSSKLPDPPQIVRDAIKVRACGPDSHEFSTEGDSCSDAQHAMSQTEEASPS